MEQAKRSNFLPAGVYRAMFYLGLSVLLILQPRAMATVFFDDQRMLSYSAAVYVGMLSVAVSWVFFLTVKRKALVLPFMPPLLWIAFAGSILSFPNYFFRGTGTWGLVFFLSALFGFLTLFFLHCIFIKKSKGKLVLASLFLGAGLAGGYVLYYFYYLHFWDIAHIYSAPFTLHLFGCLFFARGNFALFRVLKYF